ncbi:MAG: hypothetical protein IKA87_08775 [Lentisphaeria bacterium]|nr:hypothetical protein [Lentisphaeria bacterium]
MSARYGLSAISSEQLLSLPAKLPEQLRCVEFSGEALESSSGCSKLASLAKNGIELFGRDFIAPEIAGLIPEENCKLRSELETHFRSRCSKAAEYGVRTISVSFDIFQAMNTPEYKEKLAVFLKRCAGVMYGFRQNMRFVCRIPGGGTFDKWEDILTFRNSLLLPGIDMLLEMHPHEPNASGIMNSALRTFRFHDDLRRICYDPGIGNILTPEALKRCSACMAAGLEQTVTVFFAPGSGKFDLFRINELDSLVRNFDAPEEVSHE